VSLEQRLKRDNEDFGNVFGTPEGARVIAGIIDFCGVFSANPAGSLYAEGMRNVGLMLYKRATDAPGGEERLTAARRQRVEIESRKEGNDNHG
jgi:hypothetical protein